MKVLKLIFFGAILSLMMQSCAKKQSKEIVRMVSVKLNEAQSLKQAVSSINVLMLQDSIAVHFPGDLTKVAWVGDSIFVLDAWKAPGIYLYTSEGALVNSFTKQGNGPDEFLRIVDFEVTPTEVILLDTYSTSHRIVLDKNLKFIRKEEAEEQANHFFVEGTGENGVWYDRGNVAYGNNKDKLIYVTEGKRISVLPVPHDIENITFATLNAFSKIAEDTILYLPAVEPRIYKCYDGKAEVFCEFDFDGLWADFSNMNRDNPLELMQRIANDGKIYSLNMISEDKNLAISFFCKDMFYILTLKYDDLSSCKLFKVDKKTLDSLGRLVAINDNSLIFGVPGKILKMKI